MFPNINMELIQAFNPLYAIPIVAVIFCALLVYTLGFKSPIQPPSFEGLEEEKKSSKKRKTKDAQKQAKVVTNGKVNGIATTKGKVHEIPNKKEVVNSLINEKPKTTEKTPDQKTDKKAAKKTKSQNEKQQEKKKEIATNELNDDGWVQHVSKKGKKNRKKEDNATPEVQSSVNPSPIKEPVEIAEVKVAEIETPTHVEVLKEENKEIPKEKSVKKSNKKETSIPSPDKPDKLEISVEVKPDESYLEKDLQQVSANIPTVSEETTKSKKKKKKATTAPSAPTVVEVTPAAAPPPPAPIEQVTNIAVAPLVTSKVSEPIIDNVPVSMPDDSKTNVVFDELAGLYPETKEKKKKKVRRDH